MPPTAKVLKTGLIYRNPKPHVRSVHAYFPSVAVMANGEMLATLVLGEAFESVNCRAHAARSRDLGETWQLEGPLHPADGKPISDSARLTALPDGEVVVWTLRCDRTGREEEGLTNPRTLGFVPTQMSLLRSRDFGRTWSAPEPIRPPLIGPSFEICCPITPLRNGDWILPTQTWPGWDGDCPNGIQMIALVSHDRGRTWPEYWRVMGEPAGRVYFWESKIIEIPGDRLMAVAWVYDDAAAADRPNHYALSRDHGRTWSAPRSTGLQGQTLTPFALEDGRILSVYRRIDKSGLWANVSRMEGDTWVNESATPLWGAEAAGLTGASTNMAQNFNVLRFGAPCITRLSDGTLFAALWCNESCVSVIRWFKLDIEQ